MLVAGEAASGVAGNARGHTLPIHLFESVANLFCLRLPNLGVASLLADQRVGNLMQYDLLDFFEGAVLHEVFANCDSPCTKVALTCSADRSVKAEAVVDECVLNEEPICQVDGLRLNRRHF